MVRLREGGIPELPPGKDHFNSTMVRLRVRSQVSQACQLRISIPLWYDWENELRKEINSVSPISIPLWYDWEQRVFHIWNSNCHFNSTMVRLRVVYYKDKIFINIYFNSTMVRLRVKLLFVIMLILSLFQFHYGTIESFVIRNNTTKKD